MRQQFESDEKNLVLIGGGHSHAIVLKLLAEKPLSGVQITLISDTTQAPYSGMLPGYLAGFYSFAECHIDLQKLSQFTKVKLLVDKAVSLDLVNRQVLCASGKSVKFDWLSIDIGSTPATISVPGAAEYSIPAKPVPQLLEKWHQLLNEVKKIPNQPLSIAVVGGGAGGVELALSVDAHLRKILSDPQQLTLHLFHRDHQILSSHHQWVSRQLQKMLTQRGIQLHLSQTVSQIYQQPDIENLTVACKSGLSVPCNHVFWVTQASAPSWLKQAGLATDERGFILVNQYLQSVSHPGIFAAGDIATIQNYPCPKAGVFAVRQGKPLLKNLRRTIQTQPLHPYFPQKRYLALIGTGTGSAVASRGNWGFGPSPLLWWWKDWLDRRFMNQFNHLPAR